MESRIRVLDIVEDTTVDGPGFRTSIYAAGCPRSCRGCHNPRSQDPKGGRWMHQDEIIERIREAEFSGVTFTGGDPLAQAPAFISLSARIKRETGKSIWCYTGFTYEEVAAQSELSPILNYIDVLVDGPYIDRLRDESYLFAGSTNQRLIDVPRSLRQGHVVLWSAQPTVISLDER